MGTTLREWLNGSLNGNFWPLKKCNSIAAIHNTTYYSSQKGSIFYKNAFEISPFFPLWPISSVETMFHKITLFLLIRSKWHHIVDVFCLMSFSTRKDNFVRGVSQEALVF